MAATAEHEIENKNINHKLISQILQNVIFPSEKSISILIN